jgi:magnesium-transporting ATPase (P-type)
MLFLLTFPFSIYSALPVRATCRPPMEAAWQSRRHLLSQLISSDERTSRPEVHSKRMRLPILVLFLFFLFFFFWLFTRYTFAVRFKLLWFAIFLFISAVCELIYVL